jgi:hypothetical protein
VLALPARPAQLGPQDLRDVDLDDDLALEVPPAFMSRYLCVGRAKQLWLTTPLAMKSPVPVVMSTRPHPAERLDVHDREVGGRLHRLPLDGALAADRGVDEVDEAQVLGEISPDAHVPQAIGPEGVLDDGVEPERSQAVRRPSDELVVCVGDPQDRAVAVPFGVEDPGEKALAPGRGRIEGPGDEPLDLGDAIPRLRPDHLHGPSSGGREVAQREAADRRGEVVLRPEQRLLVGEGEPEPVVGPARAARRT